MTSGAQLLKFIGLTPAASIASTLFSPDRLSAFSFFSALTSSPSTASMKIGCFVMYSVASIAAIPNMAPRLLKTSESYLKMPKGSSESEMDFGSDVYFAGAGFGASRFTLKKASSLFFAASSWTRSPDSS